MTRITGNVIGPWMRRAQKSPADVRTNPGSSLKANHMPSYITVVFGDHNSNRGKECRAGEEIARLRGRAESKHGWARVVDVPAQG